MNIRIRKTLRAVSGRLRHATSDAEAKRIVLSQRRLTECNKCLNEKGTLASATATATAHSDSLVMGPAMDHIDPIRDIWPIYAWDWCALGMFASAPADVGNDLKSKMPTKRRSRAIEAEDGTLTDRAYRELEEMIVTLQLSPGTVLSEQALALRLKIGRTPIREALQRLARDGLVVIMPRRGIMGAEINLRLQLRLLEVQRGVERLMANLSAERATPEA